MGGTKSLIRLLPGETSWKSLSVIRKEVGKFPQSAVDQHGWRVYAGLRAGNSLFEQLAWPRQSRRGRKEPQSHLHVNSPLYTQSCGEFSGIVSQNEAHILKWTAFVMFN